MNTQPEALRLADELEAMYSASDLDDQAAAELRRLHEVNQMLVESAKMALEALETFCQYSAILRPLETREALRQALSKAKEQS